MQKEAYHNIEMKSYLQTCKRFEFSLPKKKLGLSEWKDISKFSEM
jgi:hypothetical protein